MDHYGPMSDRDWQAEEDAEALMRAQEIEQDGIRKKAAMAATRDKANRMMEKMKAMNAAADGMEKTPGEKPWPTGGNVTGRY